MQVPCLELCLKVKEMMDEMIDKSNADVVVLGGDLNGSPLEYLGNPIVSITLRNLPSRNDYFFVLF